MGWLVRWREGRAEAAVRRQLAALEHERRRGGHLMPRVGVDKMPKVDTEPGPGGALFRPPRMAELAGDYGHEIAADGRRMPLHTAPDVPVPKRATVDMGPGAGMDTVRRHGSVSPSTPFIAEQLASPELGSCYPAVYVDKTRGDSKGDVVLCGAHGCAWGTGGCLEGEAS